MWIFSGRLLLLCDYLLFLNLVPFYCVLACICIYTRCGISVAVRLVTISLDLSHLLVRFWRKVWWGGRGEGVHLAHVDQQIRECS